MDKGWKQVPASTPSTPKAVRNDPHITLHPLSPVSTDATPSSDSGYNTCLSLSASSSSTSTQSNARSSNTHLVPRYNLIPPRFRCRTITNDSLLDTDNTAKSDSDDDDVSNFGIKWTLPTRERHCERRTTTDILESFCDAGIGQIAVPIVFRYLDGKSLTAVCCVNKLWKSLCLGDSKANFRRKDYLVSVVVNKENYVQQDPPTLKDDCNPVSGIANTSRKTLHELKNNVNGIKKKLTNTTAAKTKSKHLAFSEEAKNLSPNERLEKCPRCSSPARMDISTKRSHCTKEQCQFIYCSLCRCPYHANRECAQLNLAATNPVSLRANRKNLRRLL